MTTNSLGEFILSISNNDKITISDIGYETFISSVDLNKKSTTIFLSVGGNDILRIYSNSEINVKNVIIKNIEKNTDNLNGLNISKIIDINVTQ